MVQLITKIKAAADVQDSDVRRMYSVYQSNYDATSFSDFKDDLGEKTFVIQLMTEDDLLEIKGRMNKGGSIIKK